MITTSDIVSLSKKISMRKEFAWTEEDHKQIKHRFRSFQSDETASNDNSLSEEHESTVRVCLGLYDTYSATFNVFLFRIRQYIVEIRDISINEYSSSSLSPNWRNIWRESAFGASSKNAVIITYLAPFIGRNRMRNSI